MDLLQRFASGDVNAFEDLFRAHHRDVYNWIVCLTRDPGAAEDLMLETFWRIYRAHARFDPRRSFRAWARRIAINLTLEHLRTAGREVCVPDALLEAQPDHCRTDSAERRDVRHAIRHAFAGLPSRLKAVALLALIEEKPYGEIASALGVSLGTVKSREFRAIRLLRKELKKAGIEP
jgi:RNA polymerase sigma-70 factor (ECF subfamily)